jgi:hypothetical protein
MNLARRIASTTVATALVLACSIAGSTAAQAGPPSNGTGIVVDTITFPDGTRFSTVSGFSTVSACEAAKAVRVSQLSKVGYAIKWVNKCYWKNNRYAYQLLYWP